MHGNTGTTTVAAIVVATVKAFGMKTLGTLAVRSHSAVITVHCFELVFQM